MRKLSKERPTWRSNEHEKVHAIINDIKADLKKERKNRQRVELVNSKLVSELNDAKLVVKQLCRTMKKKNRPESFWSKYVKSLPKKLEKTKMKLTH